MCLSSRKSRAIPSETPLPGVLGPSHPRAPLPHQPPQSRQSLERSHSCAASHAHSVLPTLPLRTSTNIDANEIVMGGATILAVYLHFLSTGQVCMCFDTHLLMLASTSLVSLPASSPLASMDIQVRIALARLPRVTCSKPHPPCKCPHVLSHFDVPPERFRTCLRRVRLFPTFPCVRARCGSGTLL